ncbi:ABC transporter substrate-binding protein [Pullulanibacillus sp. KACC 23026]|uniref:ABC transporter substrate-binding protein n=1 Tax=Pullulanibacillus sp. KACC 23026 TaxID=3028315 RepID=UPI0023B0BD98|nr:ABC transporter substrate-binding protein [Pullulanibacillus sp. KACC 23026]WEG11095.1 ABC transporter substrate-binding protein [Pullulanibacillus sp. KACC 23026]
MKHKKPRKFIASLLILLVVSALFLTGCGSQNTEGSSTTKDGKTTLVMWTFVKEHADYWKDAAKTWNKSHPKQQIDLKVSVLPFAQMFQKLQVALNSGSGAPDIADVEIGQFANYTKNPDNVPFVDMTKELKPYLPNLVKARVDNYTVGGKIYGLDYHVGANVVYYNMGIMKQAGIDPKTIKTWDDYVKAGQTVKEKTGKYMTSVETNADSVFTSMVSQQHSDVIKDGKSNFSSQVNEKTLQYLQDLEYKYHIAKQTEGGNQDNEQYYAAFNKGEYASVIMPAWYMSRMVDYMPKLKGKIEMTPMPVFNSGDQTSAGIGGTATVVTNQAHDQDLATKFVVQSKASKEGSLKTWTLLGFDPINKQVWDMPQMKDPNNKYIQYFGPDVVDTLRSLIQNGQVGTLSYTNNAYPTVTDEFLTNGMPKIMQKDAPVDSTLKSVDENADKRLVSGK